MSVVEPLKYSVPQGQVELLFLGSGTSAGVPMIGCHCAVCTSNDSRDKRTRPSVVISQGHERVLVDTSPELRLQAVANGIDMIDAVVITHAHADHIMGLDDVRRYNALKGGPLDVWAETKTHDTLTRCFGYAFKEPDPAVALFRPNLKRQHIDESLKPFHIGRMKWTPIRLFHGELSVLGFRIGNLAYCTDVSRIPDESWPLLEGLDVLVLDALQHRKHSTHFNIEEAIAAAQRVGAKQTYFTHIAHALLHDATNRELPPGIQLGYDGLRVTASIA